MLSPRHHSLLRRHSASRYSSALSHLLSHARLDAVTLLARLDSRLLANYMGDRIRAWSIWEQEGILLILLHQEKGALADVALGEDGLAGLGRGKSQETNLWTNLEN